MGRFFIAAALVMICCSLYAVEDLPDVEISGPSSLKSTMQGRSLGYSDLRIPDVTDSLRPILPDLIDIKKPKEKPWRNLIHLSMNNLLDYRLHYMGDRFFSSPFATFANLEYFSPTNQWTQFTAEAGVQYGARNIDTAIIIKRNDIETPYTYGNHHINAINLNAYFNNIKLTTYKSYIYLNSELLQSEYRYGSQTAPEERLFFFHQAGISSGLSNNLTLQADGVYLDQTPAMAVSIISKDQDIEVNDDVFSSVSLYLTENRIFPGIHLSRRFFFNGAGFIQMYQKSGWDFHDNYSALVKQPWQQQMSKGMISLRPIDTHLLLSNRSLLVADNPIDIILDLSLQLKLDEPLLTITDAAYPLPVNKQFTVLQNNGLLKVAYGLGNFTLSQSAFLQQAWLSALGNKKVAYVPLITLRTAYSYRKDKLKASALLEQFLNTRDENGNSLREAIELSAALEYDVFEQLTLQLRVNNILDKGRIIHTAIPVAPASVCAGISYRF